MDICEKTTTALSNRMPVHFLRLEDDDGISGVVVSPHFTHLPSLDLHILI